MISFLILCLLSLGHSQANIFRRQIPFRYGLPQEQSETLVEFRDHHSFYPQGVGILLTPRIVLTAFHIAEKFKFGRGLGRNNQRFSVVSFLDYSPTNELDYALLLIHWPGEHPPVNLKTRNKISLASIQNEDVIQVWGLPRDLMGLAHKSFGQIKKLGNHLKHNADTTLGNSGGPVLSLSGELLGLSIGGPHHPDQNQFYDNSPQDPSKWNIATSLLAIIQHSPFLRWLYPQLKLRDDWEAYFPNQSENLQEIWEPQTGPWAFELPSHPLEELTLPQAVKSCEQTMGLARYIDWERMIQLGLMDPKRNPSFGHSLSIFSRPGIWLLDKKGIPRVFQMSSGHRAQLSQRKKGISLCRR